jgi:hypothetical protein
MSLRGLTRIFNLYIQTAHPLQYFIHGPTNSLGFMNLILLHMVVSCGMISTHYYCICILVLITLNMATWVAETCRWWRCNKKLHSQTSTFVVPFKKIYTSDYCMEHGTYPKECKDFVARLLKLMILQALQELGVVLFICEVSIRISNWWKFWNGSLCKGKQVMMNFVYLFFFLNWCLVSK